MKRWMIILLTFAFAGVIILLCLRFFYRPQPAYNGKRLSDWAEQYGSNHWSGANRSADREAEFAIRQIGTNGIPFLLTLMRVKESALKNKLRTMLPQRWHATLHLRDTA